MIAASRIDRAGRNRLLLLVAILALAGCGHRVRGQRIPEAVLKADPDAFRPGEERVVVMHYYGTGGWGILWKGSYLLAAPYFSNHGYWDSSFGKAVPNGEAIAAGFAGTPFAETRVILVGHGHVDHAADIPAYPDEVFAGEPTLVADASTVNLLGKATREKVCALPLPATVDTFGWLPTGANRPSDGFCATGDFRIRPLPWAHAPHLQCESLDAYATFGPPQGIQTTSLDLPPQTGGGWIVGRPWAFVIELLDAGEPVFRIHYVDSAASPGFVAPPPADPAETDVHVACVPNFDLVTDYPEALIKQQKVNYVLAGHWEDFFRSREKSLRPVGVLDDDKMEVFVQRIETSIQPKPSATPINKASCGNGQTCGPRGASWTIPVPGETFWFRARRPTAAGPPSSP